MNTARLAPAAAGQHKLRAMRAGDLDAVAALDARIGGRQRGAYFLRRLEAARRAPEQHVQLSAEDRDGNLMGFLLYRIEAGEFGAAGRVAALETIGVVPERRRDGVGRALIERARDTLRRKGIAAETTRADWRNHALLGFLDGAGFALAPRQIISFDLTRPRAALEGDADVAAIAAAGIQAEPHEIDYGRPAAEPADAPARDRVPVRSMNADDFAALLRIDRHALGRERSGYIRAKMLEALDRSGVRVSLVAELDRMPVGFAMAKVEFGEFGRTEPVAVIDTIGVDPNFRRAGIASALVSQLVVNLGGLGVESIETEVARDQFDLLGFFYRWGFAPAQRLVFTHALA
ncbi:MAG TPA: GNAT family N-acetyltransferase [Alphaproteobacteria bacterium]|jgi:predicted N-acetyltransferase YhbS